MLSFAQIIIGGEYIAWEPESDEAALEKAYVHPETIEEFRWIRKLVDEKNRRRTSS
jgi:hypothetical protein